MALTITSNKKHTSVTIHVTTANATLKIAGNNSVSNIALGDEELTGATITQAFWGIDPGSDGHVVIKRGSTVVAVYDSTGYHDYAGCGMTLSVGKGDDLTVEFNSSANGFVLLEMQKIGANGASDYFQN